MKRVYVNEKWCLACHLCEFYCAFAQADEDDMAMALKDKNIIPNIRIETDGNVCFAVSCRHCEEPLCVKGCITGAISIYDGIISIDKNKCVSCYTCILSCPYGAISPSKDSAVQKCELCVKTSDKTPTCVKGCPNGAIVFEDRG